MTLQEYKDLVDLTITNKTVNYSITPTNVGQRMKDLADNVNNFTSTALAVPMGTILMYAPTTTAEFDSTGLGVATNVLGWAMCNSQNGTPDLRGKFVAGYDPSSSDYNTIGKLGGAAAVTLDATQIPAHTHPVTAIVTAGGAGVGFEHVNTGTTGTRFTNANTGGGFAHENRPPFYTVLYIKKIA